MTGKSAVESAGRQGESVNTPGKEVVVMGPSGTEGQGLIEYALIVSLVAVVIAALLSVFGPSIGNLFSNIVSNF